MNKPNIERYSFSKLSSFNTCKWGYRRTYIEHERGLDSAFSEYGSFVHELLERYAKGEVALKNLPDLYEWGYSSAVTSEFPPFFCDLASIYYSQGLRFLRSFKGYDNCKVLAVEEKFNLPVDDWEFTGVIDLLLCDDADRLILLDYKSKKEFKTKAEYEKYRRQLYLYCLYVKTKYGRNPDILRFRLIRGMSDKDDSYQQRDADEALAWARNTVAEIRQCWSFDKTYDEFFCKNLCGHRNVCENGAVD